MHQLAVVGAEKYPMRIGQTGGAEVASLEGCASLLRVARDSRTPMLRQMNTRIQKGVLIGMIRDGPEFSGAALGAQVVDGHHEPIPVKKLPGNIRTGCNTKY